MSEANSSIHDDLLFNMLKECRTLPLFLDHIFGFLQRRTDFYMETADPNSPVGLPKGLAEHLVHNAFIKWKPTNKDKTTILQANEIPQPVVEEEVVATEEVVPDGVVNGVDNMAIGELVQTSDSRSGCTFSKSESYNGAEFDHYCWSQSIGDVDVSVIIPENVCAKDLEVCLLPQRVSIKLKGGDIILEGELCQKCKSNDAVWSMEKQKLQIHLEKCKEMWWDCFLTTEARLDVSNIDCSRPFEELPEEAQAKIEELSWNHERKRIGLPTSDELTKQELLRKAWNAKGSPFSGPFDPDQVEFH